MRISWNKIIFFSVLGLALALLSSMGSNAAMASADPLTLTADTILTEDHAGSIIVGTDGITLDCAGHSITGPGSGTGVLLQNRTGVTVKNCHVSNFDNGIGVERSPNNTIENNDVSDNHNRGINVNDGSHETQLVDNTANRNIHGIFVSKNSNRNKIVGNTFNENSGSGLMILRSHYNEITDNTASDNGSNGILLFAFPTRGLGLGSNNNIIRRNTANGNVRAGIKLWDSNDNIVEANTANGNGVGDDDVGSFGNGIGFALSFDSSGNLITENWACGNTNEDGQDISTGTGNTWENNHFSDENGTKGSGLDSKKGGGNGRDNAPGLQKPFNEKSNASGNVCK